MFRHFFLAEVIALSVCNGNKKFLGEVTCHFVAQCILFVCLFLDVKKKFKIFYRMMRIFFFSELLELILILFYFIFLGEIRGFIRGPGDNPKLVAFSFYDKFKQGPLLSVVRCFFAFVLINYISFFCARTC